jgi:crotonobetainyl-CoA:carnitine CoA-transferase CaiB-like acyl-CoA transferase
MSTGAWAFGLAIANSAMTGVAQAPPVLDGSVNPLASCFKTSDGRWINFTMMQPSRYFADVCRHLDLEHLIDDERFNTFESLMANARVAAQYFREAIATKPFAYWMVRLDTLEGQWAPVQNPVEIASDPQMEANGYLLDVTDADGKKRKLVANPVQFDETPPEITRAPLFAEHTDDLLSRLGRSEDEIIELKVAGAVT